MSARIKNLDGSRSLVSGGEMLLYGIVDSFAYEGEGIRAIDVIDSLRKLPGNTITVRINSPGGSVTEGIAIYNALKGDGRKIIVKVDAMAASVASLIAMAGDEIIMAENASLMIHDPFAVCIGGSDEMRKMADEIDRMRTIIIDIYSKRTGLPREEIQALMTAESFMSAQDAVELGFATSIEKPLAIAACAPLSKEVLARLVLNTPRAFGGTPSPDGAAPAAMKRGKHMTTQSDTAGNAAADNTALAVEAERERASIITAHVRATNLDMALAETLIAEGTPVDEARARIIDAFALRCQPLQGSEIRADLRVGRDESETRLAGMSEALFAKLSGKPPAPVAVPYMGLRLSEIKDRWPAVGGRPGNWLSNTRMSGPGFHTTSDFPTALGNQLGRVLLAQMQAAESGASQTAATGTVRDFRETTQVRVGSFPALEKTNEAGEIKFGTIDENGEKLRIATYAKGIAISFQALVDDDLSATQAAIRDIAFGAIELKASLILGAFTAALSDGLALFHATHGNLAASGAAIDVDTLSAARTAMRLQKALDGKTPLGLTPKILLVPAHLETIAQQLVASLTPAASADVNPFSGQLTVAVEPRLAVDAWYLFADPGVYPTIKFVTLDGYAGPRLEQEEEFTRLGTSYRVHWHCGAAPVDFRGAFKNPGA
ncbi:MAG: ATP-dependent Clp protease proteolytic subunit [Beijerinckiaceae bacterium]|nr:ATP-dependent Clp protease proteolytic subunit [Beijerinckiaceae bacterium]